MPSGDTAANQSGLAARSTDTRSKATPFSRRAAARIGAADWLERNAPADAFVCRSASLVNHLVAAKAGIGLAVLPCYLGDPEPEIARALPAPVKELATELWIVTHADLKNTARVRAFFALVGGALAAERAVFEGRRTRR